MNVVGKGYDLEKMSLITHVLTVMSENERYLVTTYDQESTP